MTQTEALKLALDVLEYTGLKWPQVEQAITAIKAALEAKDEPVAWIKRSAKGNIYDLLSEPDDGYEPVYTTPPQQEAKDEPVAWVYPEFWQHLENLNCGTAYRLSGIGRQPLYTTPPQRKPLTDEEIEELWDSTSSYYNVCDFARAIEAAHGIKGEA